LEELMSELSITMNLDAEPWSDLSELHVEDGVVERIGLLPDGMASGKPVCAMVVRLSNSEVVIAQVSWQMLKTAVHAFEVSPIVAEFDTTN
jgi:hypothetical protein